jgi:hypothetical protein
MGQPIKRAHNISQRLKYQMADDPRESVVDPLLRALVFRERCAKCALMPRLSWTRQPGK